ncbi:MAG: YqgE/AlgH family protein [Caulobacteraceae bacterium]|nr:YqgE/AlgH family protein [Caulobacter sp.]
MTFDDEIEIDEDAFLAGRLLIAAPGIGDPRFERAVILMCAHGPEEAMGIAINRPLDGLSLPDLLDRLGVKSQILIPERAVLVGGPLERERGFVVHTTDYESADSTLSVGDGLALTATREVLDALGDAEKRPRQSLLALGYANWAAGQLEDELKANVWLICEADEALVFDEDHDTKWSRALAKIGVSAGQLSSLGGTA